MATWWSRFSSEYPPPLEQLACHHTWSSLPMWLFTYGFNWPHDPLQTIGLGTCCHWLQLLVIKYHWNTAGWVKFQPVTCLIRPRIGHTFADAAYSCLARPGFEYLCNPTVLTHSSCSHNKIKREPFYHLYQITETNRPVEPLLDATSHLNPTDLVPYQNCRWIWLSLCMLFLGKMEVAITWEGIALRTHFINTVLPAVDSVWAFQLASFLSDGTHLYSAELNLHAPKNVTTGCFTSMRLQGSNSEYRLWEPALWRPRFESSGN